MRKQNNRNQRKVVFELFNCNVSVSMLFHRCVYNRLSAKSFCRYWWQEQRRDQSARFSPYHTGQKHGGRCPNIKVNISSDNLSSHYQLSTGAIASTGHCCMVCWLTFCFFFKFFRIFLIFEIFRETFSPTKADVLDSNLDRGVLIFFF